jgi:hypothetical protein
LERGRFHEARLILPHHAFRPADTQHQLDVLRKNIEYRICLEHSFFPRKTIFAFLG